MFIILSALAYLATKFARAAPVPLTHPTSPSEPSYVPHPGGRGTVDILLSSVITLTLCVYTSIHLNITPPKKHFRCISNVWIYKSYWVLIAMFAPEFVLYAAIIQWRNAWELRKQLKELGGGEQNWTLLKEIGLWFTTAPRRIVITVQRALTTSPGTSEPPELPQRESKHLEFLQQEVVGSTSEMCGAEQRDPVRSDPADQQESLPEHPNLKQPQQQSSTEQDSTRSVSTQTDPTSPHTPPLSNPTSSDSTNSNSADVQLDERWREISMVSAFYIVMGGFAFDVHDLSDHKYIALTPHGFMAFARAGLITPDILKDDDIADRSKANQLGKLLVCVQALWMVVNCVARKASGRPTTLIELNVIVHVVVAVVVYGLWWYKPLAVANPSFLPRQYASNSGQPSTVNPDSPKVPEVEVLAFLLRLNGLELKMEELDQRTRETYPADHNHKQFNVKFKAYIPNPQKFEIQGWPNHLPMDCAKLLRRLKIKSPGLILLPGQQLVLKVHQYLLLNSDEVGIWRAYFISLDQLRWLDMECAYRRTHETGGISQLESAIAESLQGLTTFDPPNYSVQGSLYTGGISDESFDMKVLINVLDNIPLMFMTGLLSCFYAGAHASAWSSHFPTYIERWIWRGACICIASVVPFLCTLFFICGKVSRRFDRLDRRFDRLHKLNVAVFSFLAGMTTISYLLARLFIPVEAFISIRSLPVGAFETVEWVEYWPHV